MQRKLVLGAMVAGLTAAAPAVGAENPVYFGGGVGIQSATGHDDGLGIAAKAGAQLDGVTPGFGVEGELTTSLMDPEGANGVDTSFTTLGGYATYMVPLPNRRVSLKARLGLAWVDADPEVGGSDSDVWVSWGLGGQYRISSQLSAFLEHTRYDSDFDQLTGGVLVHF
ncbi:porin family protein [Thiohalorhabdus denitrificans]|uniref:Outer membrane protein beta-barrel domain-containing protein n=1 Tax=Thiohalorhabdus denitrificans TaxID=381306 RepID=A0A1G5CNE9_9GAMM|nr:porin family protein [Thiohalorhabdus denitrificans]SCY03874.1 Outer membrane protein beta-barrel domain-containing protein [Thiohalorhabdus denitrificans]